jgi:hypothetical protein
MQARRGMLDGGGVQSYVSIPMCCDILRHMTEWGLALNRD